MTEDHRFVFIAPGSKNEIICKNTEASLPLSWGWFPGGEKRNYFTWKSRFPFDQTTFEELRSLEKPNIIAELRNQVRQPQH